MIIILQQYYTNIKKF